VSLRIVEKRASTSFLSLLATSLREISAARASSSWVLNLRIYGPAAVTDALGQQGSALGSGSFAPRCRSGGRYVTVLCLR
jgi:hypothetical protein